jgi:hypothetical protein
MDELSEEDKLTVARARKVQRFMSQPFTVAEVFTGVKGEFVPLETTIDDMDALCKGDYDDVPEPAFLLKGDMSTVLEAAKELAKKFAEAGESDDAGVSDEVADGLSPIEKKIQAVYKFYDDRDAEHDKEASTFLELKKAGKIPDGVSWQDVDARKRTKWTGAVENGKIKKPTEAELREIFA